MSASRFSELDGVGHANTEAIISYARAPTLPPTIDDILEDTGLQVEWSHGFTFGRNDLSVAVEFNSSQGSFSYLSSNTGTTFQHLEQYRVERLLRYIPVDDLGIREGFLDKDICESKVANFPQDREYDITLSMPDTIISVDRTFTASYNGRNTRLKIQKDGADYVLKACFGSKCENLRTDDVEFMQELEANLQLGVTQPSQPLKNLLAFLNDECQLDC